MSESSERLRKLESDDSTGDLVAVRMHDITSVLNEIDVLKAENLEWLRIVRGYLDAEEDSSDENEWVWQMCEMRRGRPAIHTPVPIVEQLLKERDDMHEGQKRLKTIYEERGKTIAAMRQLLDSCH
jgi:hypothetical protein